MESVEVAQPVLLDSPIDYAGYCYRLRTSDSVVPSSLECGWQIASREWAGIAGASSPLVCDLRLIRSVRRDREMMSPITEVCAGEMYVYRRTAATAKWKDAGCMRDHPQRQPVYGHG